MGCDRFFGMTGEDKDKDALAQAENSGRGWGGGGGGFIACMRTWRAALLVICGQICSCIGHDTLSQKQQQSLPMLHGLCMVIPRYCHNPNGLY